MPRKVGDAPVRIPRLAPAEKPPATVAKAPDVLERGATTKPAPSQSLGALQSSRQGTLGGLLGGLTRPASSPAWSDPAMLQARMAAVAAHQNALRAEKGLPLLETAPAGFIVPMPNGYDGDETTAGVFEPWGDTVMRAVYGDLFSLNFVYRFEGAKLVEAVPYARWLLEQLPGETLTLYRQMSAAEEKQWRTGDLAQLGSDWGHGVPVVHFSTDAEQTSAAGEGPTLAFSVSKAALLREPKLWSSATELPEPGSAKPVISELVLSAAAAREIASPLPQ